MPRLRTFSERGEPLRIPIRPAPAPEPQKAVAVYGVLRHSDREVRVLCTHGQPNGQRTQTFLRWLLREASRRKKKWLLVIWDNASWHKCLKRWAATYNRRAAKSGNTRVLLFFLPSRSPWLNPIEPHWLHCKRAIYSVDQTPTPQELMETVHLYFDQRHATIPTES